MRNSQFIQFLLTCSYSYIYIFHACIRTRYLVLLLIVSGVGGGGVNPSLDPRRWIAWDIIFSNQWPHFLFEVTNPLQIVLCSYTVLLDIVDKGLGASQYINLLNQTAIQLLGGYTKIFIITLKCMYIPHPIWRILSPVFTLLRSMHNLIGQFVVDLWQIFSGTEATDWLGLD